MLHGCAGEIQFNKLALTFCEMFFIQVFNAVYLLEIKCQKITEMSQPKLTKRCLQIVNNTKILNSQPLLDASSNE